MQSAQPRDSGTYSQGVDMVAKALVRWDLTHATTSSSEWGTQRSVLLVWPEQGATCTSTSRLSHTHAHPQTHCPSHEYRSLRAPSAMLLPDTTPAPSRAIHSTSSTYFRWHDCIAINPSSNPMRSQYNLDCQLVFLTSTWQLPSRHSYRCCCCCYCSDHKIEEPEYDSLFTHPLFTPASNSAMTAAMHLAVVVRWPEFDLLQRLPPWAR